MRFRWLAVGLVAFLGCESLRNPPAPEAASGGRQPPDAVVDPGADAPRSPDPAPDHLALAAEALERGDDPAAATHLDAHVRAFPDHLLFRAQLADLLVRAGRDDAARVHFERFAADAARAAGPVRGRLVHAHTQLMGIAQRAEDRFAEALHRGAGLLRLVEGEDGKPDRDDGFCEEMLCKAVGALAEAKGLRPGDPRPRALLADAHDRAGNRRAADAERAAARAAVVPAGRVGLPQ
jgi:predicted Zn-dependent protease